MEKDKVCKAYEKFLKCYYPSLILIIMIIAIPDFKWIPRFACYIGIFMAITSEIAFYIDYVQYKKSINKKE